MKKIFKFIIFSLFLPTLISAKTIYSEYGSYSKFSDKKIVSNHLKEVETEERYLWYKDKIEYGDYKLLGVIDSEYPLIDYNDKVYGEFDKFEEKVKVPSLAKDVEERSIYKYRVRRKTRYIYIKDVYGSNGALRINEIKIKTKTGIPIKYTVSGDLLSEDFNNYINNNKTNENMSHIENGGYLKIDLGVYYNPDDISLEIYLYDTGTETKKFQLAFNHYDDINNLEMYYNFESNFTNSDISGVWLWYFDFNNLSDNIMYWYGYQTTYEEIIPSRFIDVVLIKEYRARDIKYKRYRITKEYSDIYSTSSLEDYENIDLDSKKLFYRFRTRDYIEIADDIVLTTKDVKLENYIKSNTEYKIIGDVDYNKNGEYTITLQTPFTKYLTNVKVDIKENDDIYYQKQVDKNQEVISKLVSDNKILGDTINYLNKKNELDRLEYEIVINDYEKVINEKDNLLKNRSYEEKEVEVRKSGAHIPDEKFILGSVFIIVGLVSLFLISLKHERE
jgi:hypothetical protein